MTNFTAVLDACILYAAPVRDLINRSTLDGLVTGYEQLIEGLTLPDPTDRHVLAAAIRCGASAIVTYNLRDFPLETLEPFGLEAQHPDEFMLHLCALAPARFQHAAERVRLRLVNPAVDIAGYHNILERHRLAGTAAALRRQLG